MTEQMAGTEVPLGNVEGEDILTIRAHDNCRDWNGIHYKTGMCAKTSARPSFR